MAGEVESGELTDTPRKSPAVSDHSDVERPDLSAFDSSTSKYLSQNYRHAVGASYVLATGVCGIVLVALSSSLKDLASEVDKTSVQARTARASCIVFLRVLWFWFVGVVLFFVFSLLFFFSFSDLIIFVYTLCVQVFYFSSYFSLLFCVPCAMCCKRENKTNPFSV